MKVVGVFHELGRGIDKSVQSIHSVVGKLSNEKAVSVAEYLRSGIPVFDVMESTIDPFDNSVCIDGGPSLLSDGEWIWRSDLAYFVEKYKVALPDEFIVCALTNKRVNKEPSSVVARWEEIVAAYDLATKPRS